MSEVVFQSGHMVIRWRHHDSARTTNPVLVTFPDMLDGGFDDVEAAFGWRWLKSNRISQISVARARPDWFQSPEFGDGMQAIRALIDRTGYGAVSAYGFSMGGFGALLSQPILRPGRVLAIAPQVTIDPAIVPWERRFLPYARSIGKFPHAIKPDPASLSEIAVMHDPLKPADHRHFQLIRNDSPAQSVPLYAGRHNLVQYIVTRGGAPLLLRYLTHEASLAEMRTYLRSLRRSDGKWLRKMHHVHGDRLVALMAGHPNPPGQSGFGDNIIP